MQSQDNNDGFYERVRVAMEELQARFPSLDENERMRLAINDVRRDREGPSVDQMHYPPSNSRVSNIDSASYPRALVQPHSLPLTQSHTPPPSSQPISRQGGMLDVFDRSRSSSNSLPLRPATNDVQGLRTCAPIMSRRESDRSTQDGVSRTRPYTQGYQPFLGLQSLSLESLSTSNANHARRASASNIVQRRRCNNQARATGPMGTRPASSQRRIQPARIINPAEQCLVGEGGIRVQVRVYPPDDDDTLDRFPCYRLIPDTVVSFMKDNYLLYEGSEDEATPVATLLEKVKSYMENSPANHTFVARERYLRGSEGIGLTLLEHVNRGHIYGGRATLRRSSYRPSTTIGQLYTDKALFAVVAHGFGFYDGHFVLNCVVSQSPLRSNFEGHLHACLAERFYTTFHADRILSAINYSELITTCPRNELCPDPTLPTESPILDSDQDTEIVDDDTASADNPVNQSFASYVSHLPLTIWATENNWRPSRGTIACVSRSDFSESLRKQAHDPGTWQSSITELEGRNVADLADQILQRINEAISLKDFSSFMGRERYFNIVHPITQQLLSTGMGVETEAMFTAFTKVVASESAYFSETLDGFCVLRCVSPAAAARAVSDSRKRKMQVLGALTGLMIIGCWKPGRINPLFIAYVLHGCNFHSLTPDLVRDWHPEIYTMIKRWIDMGPDGDLSPFQGHLASYHDIQPSALASRDAATHSAYAAILLGRLIIGPEDVRHPEISAFIEGLSLPCSGGYTLQKAVNSIRGGVYRILRIVWTRVIDNYASIDSSLTFVNNGTAEDLNRFSDLFGAGSTPETLFKDFLSGTGVPCEDTWNSHISEGLLEHVPSRAEMDKPSFRPQVFFRAMTGSPHLSGDTLRITFVSANDQSFIARAANSTLEHHPCIDFQTCFKTATVPLSYMLTLGSTQDPKKSIEMWLLFEFINAIGSYSVM